MSGVELAMDANNAIIVDAFVKCHDILSNHKHALVSISGGSDSDVMLDLVERTKDGTGCEISYVWFDTGLEYEATKRHLTELEERYGISVIRHKARKSIPTCLREYGQPFMSKYISHHLQALQKHGFQFEDKPYEELIERYPRCSSALKWWCDKWTRTSEPGYFDIGRHRWLKEFMVKNPPWFRISDKCCTYAKKYPAKDANKALGVDLELIGIRRQEGGARSTISTCFSPHDDVDTYRPLLWFSDSDKDEYDRIYRITHSDCYEKWGYRRTGCVGCPFARSYWEEIEKAKVHEPKLAKAAQAIFKDSYEYTRMYRRYVDKQYDVLYRLPNDWRKDDA